jgi:hypothetical protein
MVDVRSITSEEAAAFDNAILMGMALTPNAADAVIAYKAHCAIISHPP